jgi:hypothetical protein
VHYGEALSKDLKEEVHDCKLDAEQQSPDARLKHGLCLQKGEDVSRKLKGG